MAARTPTTPEPVADSSIDHLLYVGLGVAFGLAATLVGCVIAALQETIGEFLREWYLTQGFFLIALGTWLLLIIRSRALFTRASAVTSDGKLPSEGVPGRWLRFAIQVSVGVAGTISISSLGFRAHGVVLVFMWLACACVCFAAGTVTLHTLDILLIVRGLLQANLKVFRYSPARTPELRLLVNYFTSFTLMTVCTVGTLVPHWTGSREYIASAQLFWPVIYVPTCTVALIFPHVIVHRLIKREKDATLASYQQEIDELLEHYHGFGSEEVQRTNSVAELFDRISATPDYVLDFGVAARTRLSIWGKTLAKRLKLRMAVPRLVGKNIRL
jgi:hypothetical protein